MPHLKENLDKIMYKHDIRVWGPSVWNFLHTSAFSGCNVTKFKELMDNLTHTLPCSHCRSHLKAFLLNNPIPTVDMSINTSSYSERERNFIREVLGHPCVGAHDGANREDDDMMLRFRIQRDLMFAWTVRLHNAVNIRTNKVTLSISDASALYYPDKNSPVNKIPPAWTYTGDSTDDQSTANHYILFDPVHNAKKSTKLHNHPSLISGFVLRVVNGKGTTSEYISAAAVATIAVVLVHRVWTRRLSISSK